MHGSEDKFSELSSTGQHCAMRCGKSCPGRELKLELATFQLVVRILENGIYLHQDISPPRYVSTKSLSPLVLRQTNRTFPYGCMHATHRAIVNPFGVDPLSGELVIGFIPVLQS